VGWTSTKTDWDEQDWPSGADYNRIEGNIEYLYDDRNIVMSSALSSSSVGGWRLAHRQFIKIPPGFKLVLKNVRYGSCGLDGTGSPPCRVALSDGESPPPADMIFDSNDYDGGLSRNDLTPDIDIVENTTDAETTKTISLWGNFPNDWGVIGWSVRLLLVDMSIDEETGTEWIEPKTDWETNPHGLTAHDYNRPENNARFLYNEELFGRNIVYSSSGNTFSPGLSNPYQPVFIKVPPGYSLFLKNARGGATDFELWDREGARTPEGQLWYAGSLWESDELLNVLILENDTEETISKDMLLYVALPDGQGYYSARFLLVKTPVDEGADTEWGSPKIDWDEQHQQGLARADLARIEKNIHYLYAGHSNHNIILSGMFQGTSSSQRYAYIKIPRGHKLLLKRVRYTESFVVSHGSDVIFNSSTHQGGAPPNDLQVNILVFINTFPQSYPPNYDLIIPIRFEAGFEGMEGGWYTQFLLVRN